MRKSLPRIALGVLAAAGVLGCQRPAPRAPPSPRAPALTAPTSSRMPLSKGSQPKGPDVATGERPPVHPGSPACQAKGDLLDASERAFDAKSYDLALACAEEALLDEPENAPAEHERAAALVALGRLDEARLAYAHALALDPEDPETLLGAADLYLSHGGSHEADELALEYARRGERRARRRRPELVEQLELLQGMALDDLGRSGEALEKLDSALAREPKDLDARYERGSALFELCRFAEARDELSKLVVALPDDAYAQHELGLVLERLGDARGARAHLSRATELDPKAFPAPIEVSRQEFERMVDAEIAALPPDLRRDLGAVPVSVQETPELSDLTADDPPLSPTILGLYRGEPLTKAGSSCVASAAGTPDERAIVLYRTNLLRIVSSRDELQKQVRVTLWHELGHLRGADDDELRLEGLE
ncbi:MAG: metallopeptidase family protein [Deltaproteobacteria bacterium]